MSETPLFDKYKACMNQTYRVKYAEDKEAALLLTDVQATKFAPPGWESFRLNFQGPADVLLHQGTWLMTNPAAESEQLFMVPIGQNDAGFEYECIFNCKVNVEAKEGTKNA